MTIIPFIVIILLLVKGLICQYYFKKENKQYRKTHHLS